MKDIIERKALHYFEDLNCCQSVLSTVLEEKGLMFSDAIYIGTGFGGGIMGRGEVCGAVTGAVMAVGLLCRSLHLESDYSKCKTITREKIDKFFEKFEGHFGHITCNGLIGIEGNDPEAKKRASEAGIYQENCPKFVTHAVSIVLELFNEKN